MNPTLAQLLALAFTAGVLALLALIVAISRGQFSKISRGARVPFLPGEQGWVEEPVAGPRLQTVIGAAPASPDPEELEARRLADLSTRSPVLAFLYSAAFWLVVGSVFGLIVSLKFHFPDWLASSPWLTFGRLRPLHLNTVAYGWLSMAGVAVALWMLPRVLRTPLRGGRWATAGAVVWNIGMVAGTLALFDGWSDGLEWLEYPWQLDGFFVVGGALAAVPLLLTLPRRRVEHLYVSALYTIAALLWFPILFTVANWPNLHFGVEHALVNWWFAHNVLGLWFTPLGLAAAYYLIPKIVGRPIYSYGLSLLGFWALALFYSQVGVHHLIGGPVPTWVVTLSIVTSVSMVVPVIAVAVNHHLTVLGRFKALRHSPVLRFIVLGAVMYTLASVQGSLHSLRSLNTLTHFTHYTVAHVAGLLRRGILPRPAGDRDRVAVAPPGRRPLRPRRRRLRDLLHHAVDRRDRPGAGDARRRSALHGLGRGRGAVAVGALPRRRPDDPRTLRLRRPPRGGGVARLDDADAGDT